MFRNMYSWTFLKENLNNFGSAQIKLNRRPTMEKLYILQLKDIDTNYASRGDYIRIHSLKWSHEYTKDGKIKAVKNSKSLDMFLEPNIFPYNLRKGIEHYILWFNKPLTNDVIDEYLKNKFKEGIYIFFINDPINQSIKDLNHAQIFYKKSKL